MDQKQQFVLVYTHSPQLPYMIEKLKGIFEF